MKKYLIALVALLTCVHPCFAVEQTEDDYEEVELNAFGYPDKSFVTIIENKQVKYNIRSKDKPACEDEKLADMVREVAKPFIDSDAVTIVNKRRNILIIKNIGNFKDLSIDEAYTLKNRIVKARLTELKINEKLGNENFKICQSNNKILHDKLYVLMYDDNDNIKVELLNLAIDDIPSFYFYDK